MAEGGVEQFPERPVSSTHSEVSVDLIDVDVSDIELQLERIENELEKIAIEDKTRKVSSKTGEIINPRSVDGCVCSKRDIRSWCEDCKNHLCHSCSLSHQKIPATEHHQLQLVGDALPKLARKLKSEFRESAK